MAMYRQQTAAVPPQTQFHNNTSPNPSWYTPYMNAQSQHHQQFFNYMHENAQESQQMAWPHSVFHQHPDFLEHKYVMPHSLNAHQIQQYQQMHQVPEAPEVQLPSPPMSSSELSSPGANGTVTPPQQARPGTVRSPYDWITKPSYQSQPNPGKLQYYIFATSP